MERGTRALAYVRVSVVGDRAARGRFESPDLQREAIDAWCAQHGVTVVDEIRDLNRSGGTLTRPGLADALARVQAGEADGIVVARSDRASRMTLHGLQLIDELDQHGAWIAAADGSIDTTDHVRRMATTMTLAMAESELRRFRAQSAVVHRRAVMEKGRQMGPAPFGYRRDGDNRLVIDPKEAAVVRELFERRADGTGWVTLARDLGERGVRRANGRRLSSSSIVKMLRSRVYVGDAVHGEHVRAGAHPAIVTESMFYAVQQAKPQVRSDVAGRTHPDSLLRGMLRCAGCRSALKRLPSRNGRPPRWRCRSVAADRSGTHDCEAPATISAPTTPEAEAVVVARMMDLADGVQAQPDDGLDLDALARADEAAADLLDELATLEQRRALGSERWAAMVEQARQEKDAAARALAAGRTRMRQAGGVVDRATLAQAWPGMTLPEQQEMLRSLVRCVMVVAGDAPIGERMHVIPIWQDIDLPKTGRSDFDVRPWHPR